MIDDYIPWNVRAGGRFFLTPPKKSKKSSSGLDLCEILMVWWQDTHENVALPPFDGKIKKIIFSSLFFLPIFPFKKLVYFICGLYLDEI